MENALTNTADGLLLEAVVQATPCRIIDVRLTRERIPLIKRA
jgi:hypothetical protein